MNQETFAPFFARLRAEAARLRAHGALEAAATKELDVNEFETFIREAQIEALTLSVAAAESGYSVAHLQRLVTDGALPNAGKTGKPLIRRCDLPKKPKSSRPEPNPTRPRCGGPDLVGHVLDGAPLRPNGDSE